MKTPALVIIKPDGMYRKIYGHVFDRFSHADLDLVALKIQNPSRDKAEIHYGHLKEMDFFDRQIEFFLGNNHNVDRLIFAVYYGEDAVKVSRDLAGATHPEDADTESIRGAYGRITRDGVYENIVHVSSDDCEAEREIKIWFEPNEIDVDIFPTINSSESQTRRMWV